MDVATAARGPRVMLLCLFVLCATIGLVYFQYRDGGADGADRHCRRAREMGVSPYPFAMIIAIAASAAFMTPVVSSPQSTRWYWPGQLQVRRFRRVWRAVHPVGDGGQRDCGAVVSRSF